MRHTVRFTTAALLLAGAAAATSASAATPGTQTLYARQQGCGAAQEAGRLETVRGADTADGCGTIGGLPLTELIGGTPRSHSTLETYKPVQVRAGVVKGQVAARSWTGTVGGVGTVTIEVSMSGVTADGDVVDLGAKTVSAPAAPNATVVRIPFELAVPEEAAGTVVEGWTMSLLLRGQNVNANAQALNGEVFATLPITKP